MGRYLSRSRCGLLLILSLLVLGGCARSPVGHYYTLESTVVEAVGGRALSLGILPVKVPGWLDKKRLTFSDGGVRLIRHGEERWGEPLPESMTRVMVQNLKKLTQGEVAVGPWVRRERPDQVLSVDVYSVALVNQQIELDVSWSVTGADDKVLARGSKVYSTPVSGNSAQSRVMAFSQLWGELARDIGQSL